MTREYFRVPVAEVIRETDEACSLVLDVPASLVSEFSCRPGQFVTVRVPSERYGSVARCYSLSSSPVIGERPAITVKRTEGGYASNWILDRVRAGTVLDLLPPAGMFSPRSLDGDIPVRRGQRDHPGDVDPEVGAARRRAAASCWCTRTGTSAR